MCLGAAFRLQVQKKGGNKGPFPEPSPICDSFGMLICRIQLCSYILQQLQICCRLNVADRLTTNSLKFLLWPSIYHCMFLLSHQNTVLFISSSSIRITLLTSFIPRTTLNSSRGGVPVVLWVVTFDLAMISWQGNCFLWWTRQQMCVLYALLEPSVSMFSDLWIAWL